jgi:hypothetical protein
MYCNTYTDRYYTKMVKIADNYAASKTKLVSCCCRTIMTAIIIFSFFLGLSMVGEISVAAGSISTPQIGGQELEEEEQQQQQIPESCGANGGSSSSSSLTDGTNASTATGIAGANNTATTTSPLYENPEHGIQILCPENWVYSEEENPLTGDFQVYFTSLIEVQQSQRTGETPPTVSVATMQVPFADLDLQLFADLNIQDLTSSGYEIISTSLNGTLSGMPAFEVVYVDANGTMFLQDWTIQGDRAYAVIYVSHESRFNQFLPIAQDMISSFTITNDITGTTADVGDVNATTGTVQEEEEEDQQQQEVEWLLYENATHGVRMLYPSTWTQQDSTLGDDSFILVSDFFSPQEEADGYFASVTIGIDTMPPSTNLEDNLNESIDSFMQDPNVRDFQVLSSSTDDFTLAGMPAYYFESSYTDPEFGPTQALIVETIIDNKGYSIQYYADAPIYERYLPVVERMIESFEIMQQQ